MGLLLKLQNGDTKLKSLKYGKDQLGGGDSNQPFIKKDINNTDLKNPSYYNDFILRGGIEAPLSAAEDVTRLTKYFFNFQNPSGFLFTSKQLLLSRTGTKTEASKGIGYLGGGINEGAYTPLSTLFQAGVGFLGTHVNKPGIDPTGENPTLSIKKYQEVIAQNQLIGPFNPENNRLARLLTLIPENKSENNFTFVKGYGLNVGNSIVSYTGGSNSSIGIGNTYIRYATDNTGSPLKTLSPKETNYLTPNYPSTTPSGSVYKPGILIKNPDKYLDDEFTNPTPLIPRQDLKDYLVGKTYKSKANDENWKIPINASFKYNFTDRSNYTPPSTFNLDEFENGATPIIPIYDIQNDLILGFDSYQLSTPSSIYKPGTLIPIDEYKTYLTKEDFNRTITDSTDAIYNSSINKTLVKFGRQLLEDSEYDFEAGYYRAIDLNGNFLGEYSSNKTLNVDPRLTGSYVSDLDKPEAFKSPTFGYLANMNKNGKDSADEKGNTITYHNPYRVGGRGISFDFRQISRKQRGFNDPYIESSYDYISSQTDYSGSKTLDNIYYDNKENGQKRTSNLGTDDLIPFRIEIVNPQHPTQGKIITFRAYIDGLSDTYGADWTAQSYMGRGEKFYKYNTFSRDINFNFTVVAESHTMLSIMYSKLNELASSLAPTYTDAGYLSGNMHKVTIGNYIHNQWGIMNGFTYEVIEESPWDILEGVQVPLYIKVSGVKFTPIHNFRPQMTWNGEAKKYIFQDVTTNKTAENYLVTPPEDIDVETTLEEPQPTVQLDATRNFTTLNAPTTLSTNPYSQSNPLQNQLEVNNIFSDPDLLKKQLLTPPPKDIPIKTPELANPNRRPNILNQSLR